MFCDLEDSTVLAARLDPEDLRDLIVAYQDVCVQSVERYDGYVARYVGDGLLVYFGYPVGHEDNAERAVRAGLDLVEGVSRLQAEQFADFKVRVRVGIATGLVVVGDANAKGIADQGSVVGQAANLAARLQAIAAPGTVVVSDVTRQLASQTFEYRDLGRHELKGFDTPISVYEVTGLRDITRLEARGPVLTSFVGRYEELAIFADRWNRARTGNGHVVALVGPAGVGKSRIAGEAVDRIRGSDPALPFPVILQCSPYHASTPLFPITRYLARRAGIDGSEARGIKREKLDRLFGENCEASGKSASPGVAPLYELFGIESVNAPSTLDADPTARRNLLVELLLCMIGGRVGSAPSLIVVEDAQWVDPTSKLLLGRLADWARDAHAMVIITIRDDSRSAADELLADIGLVEPGDPYPDHVTVCEVKELDLADGRKLAVAAAASDGVTIDTRQLDAVVAMSGGIPLYLEQLVKAAANGFDLSHRQHSSADRAVFNTIDDALMAQIDRLGPAKEVVQHAAVIGPEFRMGLLARIMDWSLDEILPLLNVLERSRILVHGASMPDGYRFKHTLIHEISYRSLLRKNRRQIHLAVARELSTHPSEAGATSDEVIAQHFALGDEQLEAIRYWQSGARKAIARSANEEATAMLQAALDCLKKVRDFRHPELELELLLGQAMAMRSVHGYSAPAVEQALLSARDIARDSGDFDTRFSVDWGIFQCTIVKGDVEGAKRDAAALLEQAGSGSGEAKIDGYLAMGMAAFCAGEFVPSIEFHATGAALCHPERDPPRFRTHGQNPGLFCLSYMARTQCMVGRLDQGRATMQRAREIAALRVSDSGHVHSFLNTAIHAARVHHLCGDLEVERRLAEETVAMARRNHYAYYEALGQCHLGWVKAQSGSLGEGISGLSDGLAALRQTGTSLALPGFYVLLAQLYMRAGRSTEANETLKVATGATDYAVWAADIERVRGDCLAADWMAAEVAYRSSLAIARQQKAGLFICRAADSLARLLQSRGRRREGHELLAECLAGLNEGEDVPAIRQARATLQELS